MEPALRAYLQRQAQRGDAVLLVKMDRRASLTQLASVADAARSSGFAAVQIAAEERPDVAGDARP